MDAFRKNILKIYLIIFLIGGAYFIFIKATGLSLPCLLYQATGLYCPGCGITRMFQSLAVFDIAAAFSYNFAAALLLFVWVIISAMCFWGKFKLFRNAKFLYSAMYVSVALLIFYGILRNLI